MSAISIHSKIIDDLFKSFGIEDVRLVYSFDLHVRVNEPVSVEIQFFANDKQMESALGELKKYRLEEIT